MLDGPRLPAKNKASLGILIIFKLHKLIAASNSSIKLKPIEISVYMIEFIHNSCCK